MAHRVFITGGSGFVGQHMIPKLKAAGYEVLALARSEVAAQKVTQVGAIPVLDNLTALSPTTAAALRQCTYVVHAAAYMDFTYEKEKFYQINIEATKRLLALAQAEGVSRFIYISAAPVVPGSPIQNLAEDQALAGLPKALYPKTKAIAEKAVLMSNTADFTTLSLRPPAIWGPNNHHFGEMMDMVRTGKWIWIGGSKQVLSTIHVDNLSAAVLAALRNGQGGEAYFVTDGNRRTMRAFFEAIFNAYGLEPGKREIPLGVATVLARVSEFVWKTLGLTSRPPLPPLMIRLMAREFSVSDEKARLELGYRNAISFEEGIANLT